MLKLEGLSKMKEPKFISVERKKKILLSLIFSDPTLFETRLKFYIYKKNKKKIENFNDFKALESIKNYFLFVCLVV